MGISYNDAIDYGINDLVADILLQSMLESIRAQKSPNEIEGRRDLSIPLLPDLDVTKNLQSSVGQIRMTFRIEEEGAVFYMKCVLSEEAIPAFYGPFEKYMAGVRDMEKLSPFMENMSISQVQRVINDLIIAFYRDISRGFLRGVLDGQGHS